MSVTRSAMVTKVRLRLLDKTTRRDGTAISTPKYPAADVETAVNDSIRDRQPLIARLDKSWYQSTFDFIGVTNAIAADTSSTTLPVVADEQYALPSNIKQAMRLTRRDLTGFPSVKKVPYESQDAIYYGHTSFFTGFYDSYPDALTSPNETWSFVTHNAAGTLTNRARIVPAPASTSYLYRLWFIRVPTEPTTDANTLDLPPDWVEVIALDAAVYLAATSNLETLPTLVAQRDIAIRVREDDYKGRWAGPRTFGDVRL